MIDELERLARLRPAARPPTPQAREVALQRLHAAIANETARVDGRSEGGPSDPSTEGATSLRGARPGDRQPGVQPAQTGARRRLRLPDLGLMAVIIAAVAAVVIAGGALVLLGHARHHSAALARGSGARGRILDRTGAVLVTSQPTTDVQINPAGLPTTVRGRDEVYRRLAIVLGDSIRPRRCVRSSRGVIRLAAISCAVARQQAQGSDANVTVATGVPPRISTEVTGRPDEFRGVVIKRVYVRVYPFGDLAAQVLGTAGPINATELREKAYAGSSPNSIVGESGLEAYYDSDLRAGNTLQLSLDARLQQAGQRALQRAIAANPSASGGAFVAMNPQNGQIYAMGSYPTFNPSIFTKPVSYAEYKALTNPNGGDPLLNRAIQSAGPTGSTFKPITATAALESGAWTTSDIFDDTGQFCFSGQCRHNAGAAVDGNLDLVNALRVSSNDFFYNLGVLTNADPTTHPSGGPLDYWARKFGIGRPTGVDLPGEASGTLPTPRWRAGRNKLETECDNATGPFTGKPKHAPGGCGVADGTNRPWSAGDNENLAVGQGNVQVTPLQLAVAYAALANGGTIVTPHLGLDLQTADGTVLQKINPKPARQLTIDPFYRQTILDGLRAAASQPGGTSDDVMGNFPQQVYGQAGTAQNTGHADDAWYVCFVPSSATSKPILVVVHVEHGGVGDIAAAPVARQILSQWFFGKPGVYKAGTSRTL